MVVIAVDTVVNRTPDDPPLLKINDWTTNHIGTWWWPSPSCFLYRLLASISYLFYRPSSLPLFPEWLGFVINWSDHHFNRCFLISCRVYVYQRNSSPSDKFKWDTDLKHGLQTSSSSFLGSQCELSLSKSWHFTLCLRDIKHTYIRGNYMRQHRA